MNRDRELTNYLFNHPEHLVLMKSKVMGKVIQTLDKQAASVSELQQEIPQMNPNDIREVLNVFKQLQLVEELNIKGKVIFYTTDLGKEFIKHYELAREEFQEEFT